MKKRETQMRERERKITKNENQFGTVTKCVCKQIVLKGFGFGLREVLEFGHTLTSIDVEECHVIGVKMQREKH